MADYAKKSPCLTCPVHIQHVKDRKNGNVPAGVSKSIGKHSRQCADCEARVNYANEILGVPLDANGSDNNRYVANEALLSELTYIDLGFYSSGTENRAG